LHVVKNGLTTGTTTGRVNGMEPFTRVYDEYGVEGTSMQVSVLPYGDANAFLHPRDSRFIVLDRNGRIFGMLTKGAGATNRTDYVMPY
ncbi:hypothetical protein EDD15DRAFT_2185328, partial [Pisolithus albus]